ncbi:mitogen-activated protein kinase kinase kinase 7-like isoform X1 [Biomphalaria pfeifferi]|uniref:Mitogen-activated protein kinase kinase kinase 7 n=1 Tax=Biomphalaria pfeifferi TaxID=112525 RepID=A0AAD8EZX2_BIOPF|nr:mitogen-activated protein kinase kinase kinase 7-like isoform X1 [Biomphalaria pfeifferi]
METAPSFVEEIDFQELKFKEIVGKGAFGVVNRAQWRGKDVAVKRIETESEKKAFMQELKQLSRVNHPNIVRLYGACREQRVCLVMEYAEGGSLYNVLHGSGQQPDFTTAHALSWCLQCARGVEYLHNMKPKALVHRDLKPPNLLLVNGGTILKICDFGTACDIQTHMTNNKGSAAWMAPEVFEGSNYSEKCDVFSWGIILWEVLTRRKPFDEIGGPAFRIMWAVHNGKRPPLIQNFPKQFEGLLTRCWAGNPSERPSMADVARVMNIVCQFFKGGDEPLVISRHHDMDMEDEDYESVEGQFMMPNAGTTGGESRASTIINTFRYHEPRPSYPTPVVVEDESKKPRGQMSAPPSLAASRESLIEPRGSRSATPVDTSKRFSADFTKLDELDLSGQHVMPPPHRVAGHRRSGSQGTTPAYVLTTAGPQYMQIPHEPKPGHSGSMDNILLPASVCTPLQIIITSSSPPAGMGHRRIGSDESSSITTPLSINTGSPITNPVHHSNTYPSQLGQIGRSMPRPDGPFPSSPSRSLSYQVPGHEPGAASLSTDYHLPQMARHGHEAAFSSIENAYSSDQYFSLEPHLQPIPPCISHKESMQIFEEHRALAQQYLRMQAEIAVLTQRKHELKKERQHQEERSLHNRSHLADVEEYTKLMAENESLLSVHRDLKAQVEMYRKQAGTKRIG